MKPVICFLLTGLFLFPVMSFTRAADFEKDTFETSQGSLVITFIGHGTLMMEFNGKVIHIDPVGRYADYAEMPDADLILITHEHGDHFDRDAIEKIKKTDTELVLTKICAGLYGSGKILENGESATVKDLFIEAVPAYNIQHMRSENVPYHPKGSGNGYVITFGNKKVYIAGDTENIPEMADLQDIDIAFLPMNVPYTMTPTMVVEAVRLCKPKILYPYHFGNTDTSLLVELMKDMENVEVRIRDLN
jgi:L-ascorbate metabolism protein UlaG (beta-lactamase superfamily)